MRKIILTAIIAACAAPASSLPVFTETNGKVQYQPPSASDWAPARRGQTIAQGGKIRTGFVSSAELRFDDGSLVVLGPDTEFAVYTAKEKEYFCRLFGGFLKAMVKKSDRKFSVKTPAAVALVQGARFSLTAAKSGTTRVKVFNGIVIVTDAKGKEASVKPEELVAADDEGVGRVERAPAATMPNGWHLDPPYGFSSSGKGRWEMRSQEPAGFSHKGAPVTLEHQEILFFGKRDLKWTEGKPWPAQCPSKEAPRELKGGAVEGRPMFSYSCPAKSPGENTWINRYYEIPFTEEGAAQAALLLGYTHRVQAKLPAAAALKRLYGPGTPAEHYRRYQGEVMPRVAEVVPMTRLDGPGYSSVIEALLTLYQESWGAAKETYTGKVVPVIE
jgi:hypothetical protein